MPVVADQQVTECSIPAGFPELTVVVHVTKLGALVRAGGVGVEDALLLHQAGAQADALAGVLLTQAPGRVGYRMTSVKVTAVVYYIATVLMCWTSIPNTFQYLAMSGSSRRICKVMMKIFLQDCILPLHGSALYTELGYLRFHDIVIWRLP